MKNLCGTCNKCSEHCQCRKASEDRPLLCGDFGGGNGNCRNRTTHNHRCRNHQATGHELSAILLAVKQEGVGSDGAVETERVRDRIRKRRAYIKQQAKKDQ
jgi:hypothetical protein